MMIRAHENPVAWRSGILSVLVHVVLVVILLVSFNWHSAKPLSVAQVELWDSLPQVQPQIEPEPVPIPEPPKPAPVIEKPVEKPAPPPEPKAEIVIKKKPIEVKPKEEKPKPDLAKLAREEELKRQKELEQKQKLEKEREEKQRQEKIKQLQQQLLAEDSKVVEKEQQSKDAQAAVQARAAASAAEGKQYIGQVGAKIRPHVNKQLCGSGKPVLTYEINILPTGEIIGNPKLVKSSGISACDDAVYRAILESNPLPKPPPSVPHDLNLVFSPNGDS